MLEVPSKYTCTSTRGMAVADVLDSPADNTQQLVNILNTNAHTTGPERAGRLDSSSKYRQFVRFLLPAHRWSGVSDGLREAFFFLSFFLSFLLRSFSVHRHSFGVCKFVKSKISPPPEPWNVG